MLLLNIFKKLKPKQTEPQFQPMVDLNDEKLLKIVLEGQAQTVLDIIENPADFNGITSKKLLEYWLTYKFVCYSNDGFKIVIDGVEQQEYRFTPAELAKFTLSALTGSEDIVCIATTLSSALDAACVKYSELAELCNYLQENNLRVRKA
jgi:hypothetical protein